MQWRVWAFRMAPEVEKMLDWLHEQAKVENPKVSKSKVVRQLIVEKYLTSQEG